MLKKGLLFIVFFALIAGAYSQVSRGGLPPSFLYPDMQSSNINVVQPPDMKQISEEDNKKDNAGGVRRIAISVPVDISPFDAGKWSIQEGMKVWQYALRCPGALALGLYFDDFHLPVGGKLFVYNESKTQLLGAYTDLNNSKSGYFAIELVEGDAVFIEYIHPEDQENSLRMHLSELAYAYRDVAFSSNTKVNESGDCMVNINCSPEGDDWQDEKRGVARILLKIGADYGWCSGSLVNNTGDDCYPYFLTAFHCGDGSSAADMEQWVFYFNYEATSCDNPLSAPSYNSISGATGVAEGQISGGSDLRLVHLNSYVPEDYNAYFNGWNRENSSSSAGVGIHHPAGDIKKISTYTSSTWSSGPNIGGSQMASNSAWGVTWTSTTNGYSVTEGGSSGSPLFNSNGLIVGTLTGGSSSCDNPASEYYGKVAYHWESNGSLPSQQLAPWLDPVNTGVISLQGKDNCGNIPPIADFTANSTVVMVGGSVTFTDISTNFPTSRIWSFEGGSPALSAEEQKTITYNTVGTYDVQLISSSITGKDTLLRTDYITVVDSTYLLALFSADQTEVSEGTTIHFTDNSVGAPTSWSWSFPGGVPAVSSLQNPDISYYSSGTYNVSLTVSNGSDTDTKTISGYIIVSPQNFTLDFESSTDFSSDFSPWIQVDGDGKSTYSSSDCDFPGEAQAMSFIAFNPTVAGFSLSDAHGGERCGLSVCPGDATASDDWLISPQYNLGIGSEISFWVQSPKTGSWGEDEYEIAVSTTDNSVNSFTVISGSGPEIAPSTWTYKNYDLSAYDNQPIYIAVHHVSADKFMLFIDDIEINTSQVADNLIDNQAVHIYPNPAKEKIFIQLTENFESEFKIEVKDMLGRVVIDKNCSVVDKKIELNVANCMSGLYLIEISAKDKRIIEKVFIDD
ncbi:MAG: hypothetical protein C0594_15525 [Marinilabiliales bacterium]|nr:MAG: hypothetical protein C0594_15525 [Marinilabiliales bacterium]